MQDIIFYVAASETLGVVRDYANAKNCTAPIFVRGVAVRLRLRLFASREEPEAYPMDKLKEIATWQWAMDNDFNESTALKLIADNHNIEVLSVKETIDDNTFTYSEISIPMPNMNTEELASWLGTERSKSGLHGELVGFDATGKQSFILQVENFTVRNRITSAGNPTDIDPLYMTIAQIEALFNASMEVQLSSDGEAWETISPEAGIPSPQQYQWYRFRNSLVGNNWSTALPLLIGPRGYAGTITVGEVSRGVDPIVTNTGTQNDAVFNFTLPQGDKGDSATIALGRITTTEAGTQATVTNSGTSSNAVFDFTIPKGDQGERGFTGSAATFQLGTVTTGDAGSNVVITNTGTKYAAVLDFTIPRGDKGEKGDKATVTTGTTTTTLPGTQASVTNSGTEQNAVLDFSIPRGDRGECSYLYTAWAYDSVGTGFSLEPSSDRKYRAEIVLSEQKDTLNAADFAAAVWQKCLGDDGTTFGAVEVTDEETSVTQVSRIVFENAKVRLGNNNEAVISFPDADVSDEDAFNSILMITDAIKAHRSGGGSSGGDVGIIETKTLVYNEPSATNNLQSTWTQEA